MKPSKLSAMVDLALLKNGDTRDKVLVMKRRAVFRFLLCHWIIMKQAIALYHAWLAADEPPPPPDYMAMVEGVKEQFNADAYGDVNELSLDVNGFTLMGKALTVFEGYDESYAERVTALRAFFLDGKEITEAA